MKTSLYALAGTLLLAGPALAQGPLQPVQSIALGAHAALAGTIQLPNHSTVLLLTDTESPNIHLQCLGANGQTTWQTDVERYQRDRYADRVLAIGELFLPPRSKETTEQLEQLHRAKLVAMQVLSDGNTVYTVERLKESSMKKVPKDSPLKANQVHINRIDEQGKVSKKVFAGRPEIGKKEDLACMGRYVDGNGYVEIVRVDNQREETETFYLDHYDQASGQVRRTPLALPAAPKQPKGFTYFREWYQDWAYLGHRPNQTYFVRRALTTAPEQKPGQQPLIYEVMTVDDQGARTGGFSTTLGLDKGTAPRSSGEISNLGELDHIPRWYTHSSGRNSSITYDGWDNNTGHTGSFWLDYATGDVIIYGEYDEGELPEGGRLYDLKGYYQRRYALDGSTRAQMQSKYSEAMRARKKNNLFAGGFNMHYRRQTRFHVDPLSHDTEYSFWLNSVYGSDEMIDLYLGADMKPKRYDYADKINTADHLYTVVMFPQHFWTYKNSFDAHDYRVFERAAADEPPVYGALEKLRRSSGSKLPFHEFHLAATGEGKGVVVERKTPVGGSLQVYTF